MIVSFGLHSRWVHRNYTWSRNDVGSSITTCSIWFFHMTIFCFFPATLMSSTFADKNTLVFDERTYIPNTEFSPVQGSVFELSLPKQSSQWVTAQVSSKKFPRYLQLSLWFGPPVSWKTYPNIWTFRFRNFEQSGSILQFYVRPSRYCISCLSVTTW